MVRRIGIGLLLLIFIFGAAVGCKSTASTNKAVVRAVLFWSETCPHCHYVITEVLPPLQKQYGDQLEIRMLEISDSANRELWLKAMDEYKVPKDWWGVPMLFIGDNVLVGSAEIPAKLPGLIEKYLAAGGVDYPDFMSK